MKIQRAFIGLIALLTLSIFITQCNSEEAKPGTGDLIHPVELPVVVPGFHFPEDSNTIYGWMNNKSFPDNYDSASVYKHVWGIWAGLTSPSGQVYQDDSLLVYETWFGISEIQDIIVAGEIACGDKAKKTNRTLLQVPHQFQHGFGTQSRLAALRSSKANDISNIVNFWVTVSYDPNAACYATKNTILRQSTLDKYAQQGGVGHIPAFPQKAITLKPSYFVGEEKDGLIRIPVWPGPPDPMQAYGFTAWPRCVYADVKNKQQPNKKLIPALPGNTNRDSVKAATCNLDDFINFKLDAKMASYMNQQDSTQGLQGNNRAQAGQIAILVAMHVTSKEISNWAWQSFYWAPDPDHPFAPSSDLAAKLRPSQLYGAASHYAAVAGYAMVLPNQPLNGGTNTGVTPVYGYNPYLEGGFVGLGPVPDSAFQIPSILLPGRPFGVQTNCMTCHGLATSDGGIGYSTDMYYSVDSSMFKNKVLIDFAWSIQGNIISDTEKAAKKTK